MGEVKEGRSGRQAWLKGGEAWARLQVAVGRAPRVWDAANGNGLEWEGMGRIGMIWWAGLERIGWEGMG